MADTVVWYMLSGDNCKGPLDIIRGLYYQGKVMVKSMLVNNDYVIGLLDNFEIVSIQIGMKYLIS